VRRAFFPLCVLLFQAGSAVADEGEVLAESWCAACHDFPPPELLSKSVWDETVLPNMGRRLGITDFEGRPYHADPVAPEGTYSSDPLMSPDDWAAIHNFYLSKAPDVLALADWPERTPYDLFDIEWPQQDRYEFPTSTAVLIDEGTHRLFVADAYELDLEIYRTDLGFEGEVRTGGAVSKVVSLAAGHYVATTMGGDIGQTESLDGLLIGIEAQPGQLPEVTDRLARQLHRPVDVVTGDYNADGQPDFLTANFGTHTGKLVLHLSQPDGTLEDRALLNDAGVTSLAVRGDDLYVLVAQGDERVLRLNDFAQSDPVNTELLLRFPPVTGTSSMHLADINGDGQDDLLLTAGDNADLSGIFKPYHGITLYAGQPDGSFSQEWFFPFDGATSAVAGDFDLDGDTDIAAIAYYGRIEQGLDEALFVLLENEDGRFVPRKVEGLGRLGRFIAMSAGDLDGDGDIDIALANLAFGPYGPLEVSPELQAQWLAGPAFLVLRNRVR
jgi:hypothetical protein